MNPSVQIAIIAAASLSAAGVTWWVKGAPVRVVHCDPALLKPDEVCLESIPIGSDVVWVDARKRNDWEKNGVPGSMLWNLDTEEDMQAFEVEAVTRISSNPRVIVYCGDENCGMSRQVAARINALGLGAKVSVLRGGWRALNEAHRVKGSNPKP